MRQRGYIQKRRAILDHLRSKKMTDAEYIVFDALLILADDSCGIVKDTTPVQIAAAMGRGVSSIQHTLRTLEEKSYIRRDMKLGSNKPYSILIDKFNCPSGPQKGKVLVLSKTKNLRSPVYITLEEFRKLEAEEDGEIIDSEL